MVDDQVDSRRDGGIVKAEVGQQNQIRTDRVELCTDGACGQDSSEGSQVLGEMLVVDQLNTLIGVEYVHLPEAVPESGLPTASIDVCVRGASVSPSSGEKNDFVALATLRFDQLG